MNDIDLNFYSFVFSFIAIIVSVYTLYKSRKRLNVHLPEKYHIIDKIFLDYTGKPVYEGKLASFSFLVVNPSPTDIGFFDLMVLDERGNSLDFLTKINLGLLPTDDGRVFSTINGYNCRFTVLDSNYGTFKQNLFTRFDILVNVMDKSPKTITVRFKITKETIIPNSLSRNRIRKNFKQYSVTLPYSQ